MQAAFLMQTTLEEHPAMAPVMAREVERFLFRPGLAPRARYYAIVFLNQLQLSHDDARGEFGAATLCCRMFRTGPTPRAHNHIVSPQQLQQLHDIMLVSWATSTCMQAAQPWQRS